VLSCYAPFPLAPAVVERLCAAGLEPSAQQPCQGEASSLWIYDSPDRLLEQWRDHQPTPPEASQLLNGYRSLLVQSDARTLISAWRLEAIDPDKLRRWLCGQQEKIELSEDSANQPPTIEPMASQLVLRLLNDIPALLEAYLDLELQSELAGSPPDSNYLQRLQNAGTISALMGSWWAGRSNKEAHSALEAGHAALTSQLKEAQKARHEQAARVNALQAEKAAAAKSAEQLKQQLTAQTVQVQEVQEESELTLLQLHQVQEELEHYFLVSREQGELLKRQNQLTGKALKLAVDQPAH